MAKTPEEILAAQNAGAGNVPVEVEESVEDIQAREERDSELDGFTDGDVREAGIEQDNQAVDDLVAESQEVSDETIDADAHDRG